MKAIALVSGGLDSYLAAKLVQEQGVELVALNFQTPFRQGGAEEGRSADVSAISSILGIEPEVAFLGKDFLDAVRSPRFGRGKNMNPCIDCRVLMLSHAKRRMESEGAKFVVTGEVLGQRPLSQHHRALDLADRESGLERLVLRPLSATLLPPTIPEAEGWVDRAKLLAISGRGRKEQLRMAHEYGIENPPTPAGGCLLTDPAFSRRVRDLLDARGDLDPRLVQLLKYGRYFRFGGPDAGEKAGWSVLIVGRNESDNGKLESLRGNEEWIFRAANCPGPVAVGIGGWTPDLVAHAASIVARYSDAPESGDVEVEIGEARSGRVSKVVARGMEPEGAGARRL